MSNNFCEKFYRCKRKGYMLQDSPKLKLAFLGEAN